MSQKNVIEELKIEIEKVFDESDFTVEYGYESTKGEILTVFVSNTIDGRYYYKTFAIYAIVNPEILAAHILQKSNELWQKLKTENEAN